MAAASVEVSGSDKNKVGRALQDKQETSSLLVQPVRDGWQRWGGQVV